jgi:hypothetical protein
MPFPNKKTITLLVTNNQNRAIEKSKTLTLSSFSNVHYSLRAHFALRFYNAKNLAFGLMFSKKNCVFKTGLKECIQITAH